MLKNVRSILLFLTMSSYICCSNQDLIIEQPIKQETYEVICKHPMGHTMKFILTKNEWSYVYTKSGVYDFVDIKGIRHITSSTCYTNSNVIAIRK